MPADGSTLPGRSAALLSTSLTAPPAKFASAQTFALGFQIKSIKKRYFCYRQPLDNWLGVRPSLGSLGTFVLTRHQIRVIYEEGEGSVTQTIHQLYEMIETDDERVQRIVASATAVHMQRIEELRGRIAGLEEELASRVRQIHQLDLTVKGLNKQLREAREHTRLARESHLTTVMKNSQTSSLPLFSRSAQADEGLTREERPKAGRPNRAQGLDQRDDRRA